MSLFPTFWFGDPISNLRISALQTKTTRNTLEQMGLLLTCRGTCGSFSVRWCLKALLKDLGLF